MRKRILIVSVLATMALLFLGAAEPAKNVINESIDSKIRVEHWMTIPFSESIENQIEVEDWMSAPFIMYDSPRVLTGKDYVVYGSEELYAFNGNTYEVLNVEYANEKDIKIAVHEKSYIVLDENYIIFYESSKHGFGIRKILFKNPTAAAALDAEKYQQQTILSPDKKIDKLTAIGLIVDYFPKLKI